MSVQQKSDGALAKKTLASTIYEQLRGEILNGTLQPESKVKIRTVCERFDVGLSPVREALNRLASQNLVRQVDQRGFSVMPVSEHEFADLTRARILVNEAALRESIANGDAAWEEEVLLSYHRLIRTPRESDGSTPPTGIPWVEAHRQFHASLLSACGSQWLQHLCEQLFESSERYRHVARLARASRSDADEEHRAIMQTTIDRNASEAARLLRLHFEKTAELVREVLAARSTG